MELHVLNGDALKEKFPFEGNTIVCRECLIDGPVNFPNLNDFWSARADYINDAFNAKDDEYQKLVVNEYLKLESSPATEINLWFEHDLFCQVNLWFTIDFISRLSKEHSLYIVSPNADHDASWTGFGAMDRDDLQKIHSNRVRVSAEDQQLAISLWDAYKRKDHKKLLQLSGSSTHCFQKLQEVCEAEIARYADSDLSRPQRTLKNIINSGVTEFDDIFKLFQQREGVYGFGDQQVKRLIATLS